MLKDSFGTEIIEDIDNKKAKQVLNKIDKNKELVGLIVTSKGYWRIFFIQIWIGIGRGLGMTVGCSIVIGIIYQILSYLISIDIPYLTELLKQVVSIIKGVN